MKGSNTDRQSASCEQNDALVALKQHVVIVRSASHWKKQGEEILMLRLYQCNSFLNLFF